MLPVVGLRIIIFKRSEKSEAAITPSEVERGKKIRRGRERNWFSLMRQEFGRHLQRMLCSEASILNFQENNSEEANIVYYYNISILQDFIITTCTLLRTLVKNIHAIQSSLCLKKLILHLKLYNSKVPLFEKANNTMYI